MSTLNAINLGDTFSELRDKLNENFDALNDGKVEKVSGKGLSQCDYTTEEKTKLGTVATNAQVNVLESIKLNGTALTPSSKAVNIAYADMKAFFQKLKLELNAGTGTLTLKYNDEKMTDVDTALEMIVESGEYDPNTKNIVLTLANGSKINVPAAGLVDEYKADGTTITMSGNTFSLKSDLVQTISGTKTNLENLTERVAIVEAKSSGFSIIEWDSDKGVNYNQETGVYTYTVEIAETIDADTKRNRVVVDILDDNGKRCFCDYSYVSNGEAIEIYTNIPMDGKVVVR